MPVAQSGHVAVMKHLPLRVGHVHVHSQLLRRLVGFRPATRRTQDAAIAAAAAGGRAACVTTLVAVRLGEEAARNAEAVLQEEGCVLGVQQLRHFPSVATFALSMRRYGPCHVDLQGHGFWAKYAEDAIFWS